jgi:hypothetical protein
LAARPFDEADHLTLVPDGLPRSGAAFLLLSQNLSVAIFFQSAHHTLMRRCASLSDTVSAMSARIVSNISGLIVFRSQSANSGLRCRQALG